MVPRALLLLCRQDTLVNGKHIEGPPLVVLNMSDRTGAFNQPIANRDASQMANMEKMSVRIGAFNQPLGNGDTSQVTDMGNMFARTNAFNQPISFSDTSQVTNTHSMFA